MVKQKGLGRSFDSLIPTDLFDDSFDPTAKQDDKVTNLKELKLTNVAPDPEQPRRHFDEAALSELSTSIKEHGVVQPIVVTQKGDIYVIVAGERRYRAAIQAGLETIPALVRTLSDQHRLEVSLIENIQRRDLNAIETATAYLKLKDQFNMTLDQIGARVGGKSVSAVSNTLRLLKLPAAVKQAIVEGLLTEGQARPLIGLEDSVIDGIVKRVIAESWSARRVEQFVNSLREPDTKTNQPAESRVFNDYQASFTRRVASDVRIKTTKQGTGQVIISFKDEDDLKRIHRLLVD